MELPVQAADHLVEKLSTSQHARVVLLHNLQDVQQEAVLVPYVSHEEREALDGKVDDVLRLVLLTQQRNDLVDDDGDVLAQKRFKDFEQKREADQRPLGLIGVLRLEEFYEPLKKLLEVDVEVTTQVLRQCHCKSKNGKEN